MFISAVINFMGILISLWFNEAVYFYTMMSTISNSGPYVYVLATGQTAYNKHNKA